MREEKKDDIYDKLKKILWDLPYITTLCNPLIHIFWSFKPVHK